MEHWWNDVDEGRPKYSKKNLSLYYFVHQKPHRGSNLGVLCDSLVTYSYGTAWDVLVDGTDYFLTFMF